jgi:O-antigen/teichoic acid export membrane protein
MKFKSISNNFLSRSSFVRNSFWGLLSTLCQTLFLSLFFIIISRHYHVADFANFLIANTVYQLIVGVSSMGLGHWFIREYGYEKGDITALVYRFVKIQTLLGILFYVINFALAFIIYDNAQIHVLAIVLGTNIVFDNILYALKNLNIAQSEQKKTAILMAADGLLRLLAGCTLFFFPLSLINLSIILVVIRLITVNIFIQIGSNGSIRLLNLWRFKISKNDFKETVMLNWKFILIMGSAIIFWRSATIIISKFLSPNDVANYEISYKIFAIFTMMSVVASSTIYPKFIKFIVNNDFASTRKYYKIVSLGYAIFALSSYCFIQSYAQPIISFLFGNKYLLAADCLKKMYLTLLVFPTGFLQANLLVAMKKEKIDMLLNFLSLVLNITGCLVGLHFYKSLSVVNYSLFGAFSAFHLAQSIILIRLNISSIKSAAIFYASIIVIVFGYQYSIEKVNATVVFVCFMGFVIIPLAYVLFKQVKDHFNADSKPNNANLVTVLHYDH